MIDINAPPHLPGYVYIFFILQPPTFLLANEFSGGNRSHGSLRLNLALYFNTILMHRIPVSTQNIKAAEIPEPLIVKAANRLAE